MASDHLTLSFFCVFEVPAHLTLPCLVFVWVSFSSFNKESFCLHFQRFWFVLGVAVLICKAKTSTQMFLFWFVFFLLLASYEKTFKILIFLFFTPLSKLHLHFSHLQHLVPIKSSCFCSFLTSFLFILFPSFLHLSFKTPF